MNLRRLYEFRSIIQSNKFPIIIESQLSWENINFNQNEPNIIWDYLRNGTKYLNDKIGSILSRKGFTVKFAGVFVHQKPKVTRIYEWNNCSSDKLNCELGDLLTVFLLVDRNKNLLFQTAFVSQAKKENRIDNKCQRCLYEFDKVFKFPENMRRDISILERHLPEFYRRHRSLNYLILDTIPYVKYIPFEADIKVNWGFIIYQMLLGLNGLYFTKYLPRNDYIGWSRIIWDLIYFTGKSRYRNVYRGNVIRKFLDEFNEFDNYNKNFLEGEDKEGGGIPILFIIVQDKEQGE